MLILSEMGFFFRRNASFGPFRLNFSSSGIGASVGVKGARLTMTARGTTYVTVGSQGFYYRETIARKEQRGHAQVGPGTSPDESIRTADPLRLVDSSNAALINQLNQRAKMVNPAGVVYAIAALMFLGAAYTFAIDSNRLDTLSLPDVGKPLSLERKANVVDEYSLLLARYGQPDEVIVAPSRVLPLRTAIYALAHLRVELVPNGCVQAYEFREAQKAESIPGSPDTGARHRARRQPKLHEKTPICIVSSDSGSTIVQYQDSETGSLLDADNSRQRLATIRSKSSSQPEVLRGIDQWPARDTPEKGAQPISEVAAIHYN